MCDVFGQGFFYIPGTDTCLRITGQVRAEYSFRGNAPTDYPAAYAYSQAGQVYRRDLTNFRARGYLNADTRTQTAYGTLRAFVSLRLTNDTTAPGPSGGRGQLGVAGVPAGVRASTGLFQGLTPTGTQAVVDKAFIQFASITAGRSQSFFDFDAQSYELQTNSVANSNQVTELLAYTATFGNGFSATASVEDATERRIGDNGSFVRSPTNAFALPNASYNNPVVSTGTAGVLAYGGEQIPDLVANVRYDADWGSAQLAGAYHQVRSQAVTVLTTANVASATTTAPSADGFAVLGGVKVLLPMLAKGDSLTLQGTYAEGAMDYVDPVNYQPVGLSNVYNTTTTGVPTTFGVPLNDAFILTNGRIGLTKAAGGYGAFRHYFVPDVYGSLFGDYLSIVTPVQAQRLGTGTDSAEIYQIGGNVVWTPAKDFQIGAEVLYSDISFARANLTAATRAATPNDVDDYRARLSFRRAF